MYVDVLCCPKCGHELCVTALYDPFEYRYECRNPNCDYAGGDMNNYNIIRDETPKVILSKPKNSINQLNKVFNYKGYNITIHWSDECSCYWGKLEIPDIFDKTKLDVYLMEGNTLIEFIEDAKDVIDNHIEICKEK